MTHLRDGWRTIDTAPKDGSIILAGASMNGWFVPYPIRMTWWPDDFDHYPSRHGKWRADFGNDRWSPVSPQPTHWRPIAPTETGTGNKLQRKPQ